ncbi:MAG: DUF368 domain-containing protein [Desulfobacterales bacterium]|nr:DUF368 domain-containing protein [Desulfobacterales bacterium]
MKHDKSVTWKEAFQTSPGPDSIREAAWLTLKGICMGSADIVPGVSGGTMALITGIYEKLLQAIKSADLRAVRMLLALDFKGALARIHLRFLLALFVGIGAAIVSLARLINYLLHHHPVMIWSLFFGLIAASILVVGKKVGRWSPGAVAGFVAGIAGAWLLVRQIPVATPETLSFIFFSGFVAICAMILPGISGAFILLLLGKYEFITATLKNPFLLDNVVVIVVFCSGCLTGLLGFSRVLSTLLARWHTVTLAFLTGLMAGSMVKVWPWRLVLETQMIAGKLKVVRDRAVMPHDLNAEMLTALALIALGFVAVMLLEAFSNTRNA